MSEDRLVPDHASPRGTSRIPADSRIILHRDDATGEWRYADQHWFARRDAASYARQDAASFGLDDQDRFERWAAARELELTWESVHQAIVDHAVAVAERACAERARREEGARVIRARKQWLQEMHEARRVVTVEVLPDFHHVFLDGRRVGDVIFRGAEGWVMLAPETVMISPEVAPGAMARSFAHAVDMAALLYCPVRAESGG